MASVFDTKWYELITSQIARYLFAIPFIVFGILQFMNGPEMAKNILPDWPAGTFFVYLAGAALVGAGLSMILRKYEKLATFLLGLMLLIFVFTLHLPAFLGAQEEMAKQFAMTSMLKDVALAGGAFMASRLSNKL